MAPAIILATLAGLMVLALSAAAILAFRTPKPTAPVAIKPAPVTVTAATTATAKPTVPATATVTATATATVTATATATATVTATTAPTPTSYPTPGPNEGVLVLPAYAAGHRIFIDGHVKGEGNTPLVTACGQHTIQIGSAGKPRDMNIPCGALARIE